jgi:hypothetical protein
MSGWSGGTFTRVHDWTEDEANGENIESDRMDAEDDNFETGINSCLHKGGQNSPTANLPMGGYKHTGVADGTAGDDYATVRQVQEGAWRWPATGLTGGTNNAYTLVLSPTPAGYVAGQVFYFKASFSNSAAATLNVNSLGAKAIYLNNAAVVSGDIVINRVYSVVYDGTRFHLMAGGGSGSGSTFGGAKACVSSAQEIATNTATTVLFRTELYDDSAYLNLTTSDAFVIPVTGRYRVTGFIRWSPESADLGEAYAQVLLFVNGSGYYSLAATTAVPATYTASPYFAQPNINFCWEGTFTQNDLITVKVTHSNTTGHSRSVYGNSTAASSTWMAIERIA